MHAPALARHRLVHAIVSLVVILVLSPTNIARGQTTKPGRPNFLFVLIDDMGYRDLSCFGGTRVQTAEVDRLAREGRKFDWFYVNSPICSPSRCAFITGQYPGRWKITSYLDNRALDDRRGVANWLDPHAPSLPRMLHDGGYYTAHVGKWHLGGQRDVADAPPIVDYGFDRALTTFEGLADERILPTFEPYDPKDLFRYPQVRTAASLPGKFKTMPRHEVTGALVDRAIEEMKTARQQHKPFYVNLWPDDVHSPCQAPPDLRGDNSPAANYCGVLKELDHQLGRAFAFVRDDPELRDNTLILVCSDNGHEPGLGAAGELRGSKGQLYEGGIRSPLVAWFGSRMPRASIGGTNDTTLMAGFDFAPSILALAGISPPTDVKLDGTDMSAALTGQSSPTPPTPIMFVRPPDRPGPHGGLPDLAIHDGHMKLLVHRDGSRPELFDLSNDPDERTNLAKDQPDVAERMSKQVIEWDRATNR